MIPPRLIYKKGKLKVLDQRLLPHRVAYLTVRNAAQTAKAIKDMVLRGAPLIGCAAAWGFPLELRTRRPSSWKETLTLIKNAARIIKAARPTALALFYAADRMQEKAAAIIAGQKEFSPKKYRLLVRALEREAAKVTEEDRLACARMGALGADLLKKNSIVLTHCNAGALATMGIGTAVGVITEAHARDRIKHAYSSETRPYLQGARLTIWELQRSKVPSELITDNMAAHLMKTAGINAIIVGADRIAANGDTANKIGTYALAVLAGYHKIPFYVIAPTPTIDASLRTGEEIKIEERSSEEVTFINGRLVAPKGVRARHPGFDVTPAKLITAIVTEKGVIRPVNRASIKKQF
ncbi:MAG: S-methyl-5-thioribose-1-phosphate isomerase [Elusimicrobia bacterium GWA2_56_46]|nr:MAG: S-methyl-5-thioribose-1-phosphate isomerase [Elusimicrobia bacterium GWA2_56_46]OGR53820.1 MAG: S-methyl-5-thioribose-1-phosphate isomerase [Elusimicrobia bacterium GWC2_56_31]HBB66806.1 S-methyl-5-thioribose-1-phosphate isomerase [Elusimicrobiota bacterium]HBW22672.1 S-methyl-5-thioribose-1-phosphate isomerase [Elusimicrobiota bacterium]